MSAEANKIIYAMIGVSKHYGRKPVLQNIYLSYFYGAKIGVLGLNGSGKSSLLRILAGRDTDFTGETTIAPGFTVGMLEQEPLVGSDKTVLEVVKEGVQETVDLLAEFEAISEKFAEPMDNDEMMALLDRQAAVQDKIDHADAWDLDARLEMAMDALRCAPPETKVSVLSGGERRRVALCRLLLNKPDILLLDEPTNHLDAESVNWLEEHLRRYEGTVIAVTHDRYFLDNVAGWILELDRGKGIPWQGNYSSWLDQKGQRLAQEEKTESDRQRTLKRELAWIQMSPKGRHAKGAARIKRYEALLAGESERRRDDLEIFLPPGPRLGDIVIEAKGVRKAFGDKLLVEDLNFALPPGGIVGVIGPNGAGKTTLFRMITGAEQADSGSFRVGETVKLAHVDQGRDGLDPDKTIWEVISDGQETLDLGKTQVNSRAWVARFNFSGSDQQKKVGEISGGERNRVHLARLLKTGANVLLLDEPTNDLDVNTLRPLEEALANFGTDPNMDNSAQLRGESFSKRAEPACGGKAQLAGLGRAPRAPKNEKETGSNARRTCSHLVQSPNFAGCAVVISHDRWFLDRIATHILAFEGDSQVVWFPGNYSDYEQDRRARLGADSDQPKRLRYRPMERR